MIIKSSRYHWMCNKKGNMEGSGLDICLILVWDMVVFYCGNGVSELVCTIVYTSIDTVSYFIVI